jgi:hypothetical protein
MGVLESLAGGKSKPPDMADGWTVCFSWATSYVAQRSGVSELGLRKTKKVDCEMWLRALSAAAQWEGGTRWCCEAAATRRDGAGRMRLAQRGSSGHVVSVGVGVVVN